MTIEQFFKNSFVITIDDKRYKSFNTIFSIQFGKENVPQKVIGSQSSTLSGPQNCTSSHFKIVKMAKCKNLPFVVIFEDDAYPCIDCRFKLDMYLQHIPNKCDFILLGWSNYSESNKLNPFCHLYNKITNVKFAGSHSYILFNQAFDQYLNFIGRNVNTTADGNVYNSFKNPFVIDYPLFIQYSENKSMNNHYGYILYGNKNKPPIGYADKEKMMI